jgi:hypothetical protein
MPSYIASDGPKYWLAYITNDIQVGNYGYLEQYFSVDTQQSTLEVFDTEQELADRIDALKGTTGWYYEDARAVLDLLGRARLG